MAMSALHAQLGAAFAMALFGGVHCAGMCGGFAGVMSLGRPAGTRAGPFTAAYHLGRLGGYAAAGALVGAVGARAFVIDVLPVQIALLALASVFLAGIGVALLGANAWLRQLEPMGLLLWQAVRPLAGRVMPPRHLPGAAAAGFLWGWIPCGMVYAALPMALVSGSAHGGAAVMLAFGMGTLPNLLAISLGSAALRARAAAFPARRALRTLAGITVLVFAASDLAHAARLAGAQDQTLSWLASVCNAPR